MINKLYLINLSLLITHEIDSAFWKEWEMFYLPGGIQFFNVINFLLIIILIYGYGMVILRKRNGYTFSIIVSATGLAAFIIHGSFLLYGFEQFMLPVSLLILISCFAISIWQLIYTVKFREIFK